MPSLIGNKPNQVPTNGDLGTLAFQDADNVKVGSVSATSLTDSGNLNFTGTGNRITGDFSNATVVSRAMFQTSTTNGITRISAIPNGTGAGSIFTAYADADPTNSETLSIYQNSSASAITSSITGTGTYTPLTISTGGSERLRIDTSGNVGIGTSSPVSVGGYGALTLNGTTGSLLYLQTNASSAMQIATNASGASITAIGASLPLYFSTNSTERMRIESGGNVLINTTTAVGKFTIKQGGGNAFGSSLALVRNDTTDNWQMVIGGDNLLYLGYNATSKGTFSDSTGIYTPVSDIRLKKNIENISYGLNEILKLRSVEYHMNEESNSKLKNLGFIAQEANEVLPESVCLMQDGMYGMDRTAIIPVLVKAIQEQQTMINELKAKVDAQAAEIQALKGVLK